MFRSDPMTSDRSDPLARDQGGGAHVCLDLGSSVVSFHLPRLQASSHFDHLCTFMPPPSLAISVAHDSLKPSSFGFL